MMRRQLLIALAVAPLAGARFARADQTEIAVYLSPT